MGMRGNAWNCKILRATAAKITQQHAEIDPNSASAHTSIAAEFSVSAAVEINGLDYNA